MDIGRLPLQLRLLLSDDRTDASSEGPSQLSALLRLPHSLYELVLEPDLPVVLFPLDVDLLLELLDLVEVPNQVLLVVRLNVAGNRLDSVALVVHLTEVKLVLDEVSQFHIVLLRVQYVSGSLAFREGLLELGLELVGLRAAHAFECVHVELVHGVVVVLRGHRRRVLVVVRLKVRHMVRVVKFLLVSNHL